MIFLLWQINQTIVCYIYVFIEFNSIIEYIGLNMDDTYDFELL